MECYKCPILFKALQCHLELFCWLLWFQFFQNGVKPFCRSKQVLDRYFNSKISNWKFDEKSNHFQFSFTSQRYRNDSPSLHTLVQNHPLPIWVRNTQFLVLILLLKLNSRFIQSYFTFYSKELKFCLEKFRGDEIVCTVTW